MRFVLGASLALFLFGYQNASAQITITMQETGDDVVFSYSGSLDISALSPFAEDIGAPTLIISESAHIQFGANFLPMDGYIAITGPSSFGTGSAAVPTFQSTGDPFLVASGELFYVPADYVSGTEISGSMTLESTDFATLEVDTASAPYVWTVQNSAADTITLQVVPEPSSAMFLATLGAAFTMRRRRRVA